MPLFFQKDNPLSALAEKRQYSDFKKERGPSGPLFISFSLPVGLADLCA